jgi:hypothetical protein
MLLKILFGTIYVLFEPASVNDKEIALFQAEPLKHLNTDRRDVKSACIDEDAFPVAIVHGRARLRDIDVEMSANVSFRHIAILII